METRKILTILVLALGLLLCAVEVSEAEPMGTAFTYQGRLVDANYVADGVYDFNFGLYNSANDGNQVGSDVNKPDIDLIDGYFTVELDFSNAFDGNAVWLEIGVRPGDQNDPCVYEVLGPRQEVTAVPYALYALETENGVVLDSANTFTTGVQEIQTGGSSTTGLVVKGAPSQTANLQEWHNSSSSVLASVSSGGGIVAGGFWGNGSGLSSLNASAVSSGTLAVTNGGTGASTAISARSNLGAAALGSANTFTAGIQEIRTGDHSLIGLLIRGTLGQTANLQEWRNNLDVVLGYVSASGVFYGDGSGLTNLTNDGDWTISDSNMYSAVAGNVGIGTDSPSELVDVNGTVKATAFLGDGSGLTNLPDDGDWTVSDSNMYSAVAGSVGIGTSSPDPEDKLDVIATGIDGVGVFTEATRPTSDTTGIEAVVYSPNGVAGTFVNESGGRVLMCHSGTDPYDHAFSVDGNGDIVVEGRVFARGIGTSVFDSNLSVFGSVDVNNNLNAQGDGYIGGTLNVGTLSAATISGLNVQGNGSISGTLNCYNDVAIAGNLSITGSLSKGSGTFKIDHPLDPENRYLSHSFVESPDMMNVYNGNAMLDKKGCALIELPEYFEALNIDFRYQLTCIGGFAPVYIAKEISNNHFKIAGGKAGMKVSWQVTGIRQDAYAKANRIVVEQAKSTEHRGYYLYPQAYGFGEDKSITHLQNKWKDPVVQVARKAGKL